MENYKLIKRDLDRLRTIVEKSELWVEKKGSSGGGDSKKDNEKSKDNDKEPVKVKTVFFHSFGNLTAWLFS